MQKKLGIFLIANAVCLTGAWVHFVALYWLAYQLTQSAVTLGLLSLVSGIPMLLFSLIGGALSDQFPRKPLLCFLQLLSAISALGLSFITYIFPSIEALFIFSAIFGILFSLESPLKQTILPNLLDDKDQLSKAISWNTIINNLARIAGPLFCSFFMLQSKIYIAFAIYGCSIFISAILIYSLDIEPQKFVRKKDSAIAALNEGLRYVVMKKQLFYSILATSTLGFCMGPYTSQIPSLVKEFYPTTSNSLTFFYAATGLGGLLSALALRYIRSNDQISPAYYVGFLITTAALPAFFLGSSLLLGLLRFFSPPLV